MSNKQVPNKIILINPKTGIDVGASLSPPHGLLSIAAELVDDFEVKIIDQRVDKNWKSALNKEMEGVLCVGITSMCGNQIKYGLDASKLVKNKDMSIPILWGGMHPTFFPQQTLKNPFIDFVIKGDGELTVYDLAMSLKNKKTSVSDLKKIKGISFKKNKKIFHNPDRAFFDLNKTKPTPWHLIDVENYIHKNMFIKGSKRELDVGITSRGCPFNCGFCPVTTFHKRKWRAMSAEKSAKRIIDAVKKFNLDGVWLRDDEFFLDVKRVQRIAELIIKAKINIKWYTSGIRIDTYNRMTDQQIKILKKSGCEILRFGVETGSARLLKLINKRITFAEVFKANKRAKKFGMTPYYSFMVGLPTETVNETIKTVALANRLKRQNPHAKIVEFTMFIPIPGSPLFDMAVKMGLKVPKKLEEWSIVDHFNSVTKVSDAPYLSKKDIPVMKNIINTSTIVSDMVWDVLPVSYKIILFPMKKWAEFRWKNYLFKFMPEINLWTYMSDKFLKWIS